MKKSIVFCLLFSFIYQAESSVLKRKKNNMKKETPYSFALELAKVDSLIELDQTESALNLLYPIFKKAIEKNHAGYYVICARKEIQLLSREDENNTDSLTWNKLNQSLVKAPKESLAFLYLDIAQYIQQKFINNKWRDENKDDESKDPNEWSNNKLYNQCLENCRNAEALSNQLSINDNTLPLIVNYETTELNYNIEQMVCLKIIDIVSQLELTKTIDYKDPYFKDALAPTSLFLSIDFNQKDDPANDYYTLRLYQKILKSILPINEIETGKLIYLDLKRIQFAKKFDNSKDNEYTHQVHNLLYEEHHLNPYSNLIANKIVEVNIKKDKVKTKEFIETCLKKHPKFKHNIILEGHIKDIEEIRYSLKTENTIEHNKSILAQLNYQNLTELFVQIYQVDYKEQTLNSGDYHYQDKLQLPKNAKMIDSYSIAIPKFSDYNSHTAEIAFKPLQKGSYIIKFGHIKDLNSDTVPYLLSSVIMVTELNINRIKNNKNLELVNAKTGEAVSNYGYKIYSKKVDYNNHENDQFELIQESKTDKNGHIELSSITSNRENILIEIGNNEQFYSTYYYPEYENMPQQDQAVIHLFTDRTIYRPGQTVYFKGIAYKNIKKEVISGVKINVTLKDNNYQDKGTLKLSTNEFGSFSGSFVLPVGGFNSGGFYIYANEYSTYFQVEEYKRPKYSAEIISPETSFKLNDAIKIKGKATAFAGYPIQNANVSYTVVRSLKPIYWWDYWSMRQSRMMNSNELTLVNSETKTNDKGEFEIEFKALPDELIHADENPYFNYQINAVITDLNGEVRTCEYTLTLAYTDIELSISANTNAKSKQPIDVSISCKNLQGVSQSINGELIIEKLEEETQVKRTKIWGNSDTTAYNETEYNKLFPDYTYFKKPNYSLIESIKLSQYKQNSYTIKSIKQEGSYKATLMCKDANGKMIKTQTVFEVKASQVGAYQLPKAIDLALVNNAVLEPKQKAKILLSSGTKAVIKLIIKSHRGEISNQTVVLNKETKAIEIPILEADRGGITIDAYTTNNYRFYHENLTLDVPYSNKELSYSIKTLRDKTEPGAKEKWTLTLKGPKSSKVLAETLASMYDQSLDAIAGSNNWYLWPYENIYNYFHYTHSFGMSESRAYPPYQYEDFQNNNIIEPVISSTYMRLYFNFKNGLYSTAYNIGYEAEDVSYNFAAPSGRVDNYGIENKSLKGGLEHINEVETKESNPIIPSIRKNFNETAFFFPHILTNKKGELVLEFTMPESLTQWKLMLFGHTKDLKIGEFSQSITTSKKLMVQPDVPRFLREKDKISIATKIVNTSSEIINAKVQFILTDIETGKELNWFTSANSSNINIPANDVKSVAYELAIPNYTGLVKLSIQAIAGKYSDGEEHTLAVLSNRKLITESLPITVRKKGTQTLDFTSLSNNQSTTLSHHQFSIELCSNPSWYAVQSLPYLVDFPHECAEQTFSKLYANTIAHYIASTNKSIKPMIEKWQRQATENPQSVLSKLELNQDLKYTVIEETPWLLDAKKETEQIKQLSQLFNQEKLNNNIEISFERLKELQHESGAWGWFKGMYPNTYITETIVIGFGKMKAMGINVSKFESMINNAINYLDREAEKDYNLYYKNKNIYTPSANHQYLYCKSYFPQYGFDVQNKIVQFHLNQAEMNWQNHSLMNRAQLITAIKTLNPNSNIPDLILKAFKENAIQKDEMGMYWKQNTGGYYWHESAIETQAAIIEAYSTMKQETSLINELQIWLLRQKQTQNWKTTRATADACYALLMTGKNLLDNKQEIEAKTNDFSIKTIGAENGTGYIRQSIEKEKINNNTGKITVTSSTDNFGYGAAYWQYFEDLNKIKSNASGIVIEKKIYKVVNTAKGTEKQLVKQGDVLSVGDLIEVSLSLSTDRNLEYVHIKDLRASGTEPMDVLSGYKWQNGAGFYQTTLDASTNFFVDYLSKGNYQFNYQLKVQQAGEYSSGLATAQCMYAPEYTGNSSSIILQVK